MTAAEKKELGSPAGAVSYAITSRAKLSRDIAQHDAFTRQWFRHSELGCVQTSADVGLWRRFNPKVRAMLKGWDDLTVFDVIAESRAALAELQHPAGDTADRAQSAAPQS